MQVAAVCPRQIEQVLQNANGAFGFGRGSRHGLLLVQAEVELLGQEVQAYEVEASEVEKEEGTDKLSEKSESRELPLDRKKMMGQTKMSQHRQQTSGYK